VEEQCECVIVKDKIADGTQLVKYPSPNCTSHCIARQKSRYRENYAALGFSPRDGFIRRWPQNETAASKPGKASKRLPLSN
jgi:predicted RNA-binding Zn-ribbon protein involved in translation (DUF1610 family)